MKMDTINGTKNHADENYLIINAENSIDSNNEIRKRERQKSDLISKKLGELLLQGYRMLNATCEQCDCILMQKKNEPQFCVGCQDKELLDFVKSFEHQQNGNTSLKKNQEEVLVKLSSNNMFQDHKLNENPKNKENHHIYNNKQQNALNSTISTPIDTLSSKIQWATNELKSSTNVRYNIELCEMIKSASEALVSLKKVEI